MSDEYISRNEMIAQTKARIVIGAPRYNDGLRTAIEVATSIPATDVVEVVRCAECRCFQINMRQDGYLPEGVPECECRWWCGEVDPTDYCSHAKRKDGGQDDG